MDQHSVQGTGFQQCPAIPIFSLGRLVELIASWSTWAYKGTITLALPTDDDDVSQSRVTIETGIKKYERRKKECGAVVSANRKQTNGSFSARKHHTYQIKAKQGT